MIKQLIDRDSERRELLVLVALKSRLNVGFDAIIL